DLARRRVGRRRLLGRRPGATLRRIGRRRGLILRGPASRAARRTLAAAQLGGLLARGAGALLLRLARGRTRRALTAPARHPGLPVGFARLAFGALAFLRRALGGLLLLTLAARLLLAFSPFLGATGAGAELRGLAVALVL